MTRVLAASVAAACATALATAFTAQYVFGLMPCNLCLIERVPFALAGLLALAAVFAAGSRRTLMAVAGTLLVLNGGIAFYHVGVEHHWWASAVCSGAEVGAVDVNDLAAAMSKPVEMPCDTPVWSFHGITFAFMNIFYAGGLGLLTLALLRQRRD